MLLILLGMSVNATWAQGNGGLNGGDNPENPATWFYVNLTAKPSTPACGTNPGQVWLRSVALTGDEENPYADSNPWLLGTKPTNPYDQETKYNEYERWKEGFEKGEQDARNGLEEKAYDEIRWADRELWQPAIVGYDEAWDWYKSGHYLNPGNPVGFAETVSLKGYTLVYAPGFEDLMGVSAYASFCGKAQGNDGWYFAGWSFTEGDTDLGVGDENGVLFRVLPSATTGEANIRNEYVYATFKPVMVSDYKVNGLINKSVSNTTTVVFDAVGQRVSTSDFTVAVPEDNFSAEITSCIDNKVTVTVTYNGSANGEFRGNVTLASKSGCSQLTAPVYARVGADADAANEATLYDGKTPTATSGTLEAMIAAANGTDKIVVLNKNYESNLTINANVTLNFNGYTVQDLTVAGGEVTIAYDKYGSNGEAVSVTGGKLILNGGKFASLSVSNGAVVEQNGATITGAATNNGTLVATEGRFEGGLTSTGAITVNGGVFEGNIAITINGGTAIINKATISGTATGILINGGETTISSKLVSVYGGTNAVKQTAGSIALRNGKFDGATPLAGAINLHGGYFKTNTPGIDIDGKKVLNVLAGTEYAEGYRYFIGEDATGIGVCRIGTTSYATLEAALAYANNNPTKDVVIIMTNDYTLPAGYYTLPARATLIVPMSDEQETGYESINRVSNNSLTPTPYVQPFEFRRLTFAHGVNMDVHGTIELTCTQRASDDAYATLPHGPYGHLVMEEGSHMTLQNGSKLRAWGYMTGKGETDARRGATVHEQFQMGDWKGGSVAFSMLAAENTRVFPITQYYIQNVESPVKYHPGAVLTTTTSVSANFGNIGVTAKANDIKIVGVSGVHTAMFLMDQEADAENTWVRKWYDAEKDVQTYEVNSGAHLGSMVLDLGKLGTQPLVMNSGYFVLPITNNMKIHLLSGMMDFTQTTSLLPGAEVEVDKESVIKIVKNSESSVYSGALYVYDADDWSYAGGKGDAASTYYTKVVPYSPSFNGKPNKRSETEKLDDAKIYVHGSFDSGEGAVYTTPGGANIFSTNEDAGTFVFSEAAPTTTSDVYQYVMTSKTEGSYAPAVPAESAKLKNSDGPYTETTGAPAQMAFVYRDGAWQSPINMDLGTATFNMDCYTAEINLAAYLDIIGDEEHPENQLKIAIYHAPDNIAEYLLAQVTAAQQGIEIMTVDEIKNAGYDLGPAVQKLLIKPQEWVEIAGTAHAKLDMFDVDDFETMYNQGVQAGNYDLCNQAVEAYKEYFEAQSARPYMESVEGNADHTFSDADGAGRLFILMDNCQWWEVEKKDNLYHCIHPNNDTYYEWGADEFGREKWLEKRFTITWKNYDGTIIQTADADGELQDSYSVTYGTMAEFRGTNPTREATIDYTYDFAGWSPALGPVTSDVTYTATFDPKPRMYTIVFQNEGGVEIERQFLTHNEVPVCENTPTKVGHTLVWEPAIAAVTGDATYRATWLENPPTEYQITFFDYDGKSVLQQSNVAVGAMPEYTKATPTGKATWAEEQDNKEFTYVFDHWSPALEAVSATSVKTYTAVYREEAKKYTVIFQNEDGSEIEHHEYAYGETPVCSATPTKAATAQYSYTFAWDPQIETVRGAATYKATFTQVTNRYTVTLKSNPSGACTFTGAGTFNYGTAIAIARVDNEGYTFSNWTDGKTGAVVSEPPTTITGDINLVANFTVTNPDYTITWKNEDGSANLVEPVGQKANTATIYTGAIPTKPATAQYTYTFDGWTTEANGAGTFYKNNMTPKATEDATYYAHFAAKEVIMEVGLGQAQNIAEETTVNQLILHSNGTVSGQLTGDLNDLNVTGVCYYDLTGTFTAGKWYAVAVPWQVTASDIRANGNALSLMSGDYLAYYDGSVRAAQGKVDACWKYLSNGDVLVPGSLYMLYLQNDASVLRFPKKSGTPILTSETNVSTYGSDEPTNANWNGIANPAIFYAYLSNTGATVGQVFNAAAQSYEPVALSTKLIVAKPIFVQATNSGSVPAVTTPPVPAPVRHNAAAEAPKAEYQVEIASYGRMQDRLFIHTNEDKEADTYTLGQDVVKFGVSNTVAQMWVDRYDAKLCMNTMTPVNNVAEFPLGIYVPRAGEYQISNVQSQMSNEAYTLYLTYNGEAIWNLTESDYVLHLEKGTAANYGLRVSAKAPQVATGIDEAVVDAQGETKKVLINNQVFIIRGEKVYTIDGQLVK